MTCPYTQDELDEWAGWPGPLGEACYCCQDHDCEHFSNFDIPEGSDKSCYVNEGVDND